MIRKADVNSDAFRQKMEEETQKYGEGVVHLRVQEVPPALFNMVKIRSILIEFTGKINIPDELAKVKIDRMALTGEIDKAGKDRIKKLFPNTEVRFAKDLKELYAPPPPPTEDAE